MNGARPPEDFPSPALWAGLALLSLCACAAFVAHWEEKLLLFGDGVLLRAEGFPKNSALDSSHAPSDRGGSPGTPGAPFFQNITETNGQILAEYGFLNFNNDALRVSFSISEEELTAYKRDYGYSHAELDALYQWQVRALSDSYQYAAKNRLSQEQIDRMADFIRSEYKAKCAALFATRGFTLLPNDILVADIPGIVKRNVMNMRSVALTLSDAAQKRSYGSDDVVSAALSLVQAALIYENVPMTIDGRQTGGIYPPVETMAKGKGDCDTKVALLASILLNWNNAQLVGVGVPNHYLMGILRNPAKGDAFVEYNGLQYVLVEPAGPAWLPLGWIGPETPALLNAGRDVRIEPLAAD